MSKSSYKIIRPGAEHFRAIQDLCVRVYPFVPPWSVTQLESHQNIFPEGQMIIIDENGDPLKVLGLAFSLIVFWDDYESKDSWKEFTDTGHFRNHDPQKGRTLYGAEIMVDPNLRGKGLGKMLYAARRELCQSLGLLRIRAGARLRGYSTYKNDYTPAEYIKQVVQKKIFDPTLSFQLKEHFVVLDVVKGYLGIDPESLGFAAVIEWLNLSIATADDIVKSKLNSAKFL